MKFNTLDELLEWASNNFKELGDKIVLLFQNQSIASLAIYNDEAYKHSVIVLNTEEGKWKLIDNHKTRLASLAFMEYAGLLIDCFDDEENSDVFNMDNIFNEGI